MLEKLGRIFRRREEKTRALEEEKTRDWEMKMSQAGFSLTGSDDPYYNDNWPRQIKKLLPPHVIDSLVACLPSQYLRLKFFTRSSRDDVMKLLDDFSELNGDGAEVNLVEISQRAGRAMTILDETPISVFEQNPYGIAIVLLAVVGIVQEPLLYQLCLEEPQEIANLIGRHQGNLYRLTRKEHDLARTLREYPDLVEQLVQHEGNFILDFLLERPDIVTVFHRHPGLVESAIAAISGHLSWPSRLRALQKSFEVLKIGDVTQDEIDLALLRQYATHKSIAEIMARNSELSHLSAQEFWEMISTRDPKKDKLAADYFNLCLVNTLHVNKLPTEKRYILLVNLKKSVGRSGLDMIRQEIRTGKEHQSSLTKREARQLETLARAAKKEDARHPANSLGIARLTGFEIEYSGNGGGIGIDREDLADFHEFIGIHHGRGRGDAAECSPGPFHDPQTGIEVFRMFVQAGIIDLCTGYGHTFHFNTQIDNSSTTIQTMIWSLYATGAAYGPQFTRSLSDEDDGGDAGYSLRIYPRKNGQTEYTECKAFDVMTPEGFEWSYEAGALLSCAAGAYQDILDELDLTRADENSIRRSKANQYRKRLAYIWIRFDRKMLKGFTAISFGKNIHTDSVPPSAVRRLDREVGLVYPTIGSRYKNDLSVTHGPLPTKKGVAGKIVPTAPIKIRDKTWPNIVAFATETVGQAMKDVQAVLDSVENNAITDITAIEETKNEEEKFSLILRFIEKYKVVIIEGPSQTNILEAYSEVKALFQDQL